MGKARCDSRTPGQTHSGLPLTPLPSPHAHSTPGSPPLTWGVRAPGNLWSCAPWLCARLCSLHGPSSCLQEAAPASRRKALVACRGATVTASERQWQRRRLRAARPPEIDRRGPVTSGSGFWFQRITRHTRLANPSWRPPTPQRHLRELQKGGEARASTSPETSRNGMGVRGEGERSQDRRPGPEGEQEKEGEGCATIRYTAKARAKGR